MVTLFKIRKALPYAFLLIKESVWLAFISLSYKLMYGKLVP